jgi:hypothetical protein
MWSYLRFGIFAASFSAGLLMSGPGTSGPAIVIKPVTPATNESCPDSKVFPVNHEGKQQIAKNFPDFR